MTKLALFDMDGTLSDDSSRRHLYKPGAFTPYWEYDKLMADPMWYSARLAWENLNAQGISLGVLSARSEKNRDATEEWLKREGFPALCVLLKGGHYSKLSPAQFKLFMLIDVLENSGFEDVVLYENDREVVDLVTTHLGSQYVILCTWDVESGEAV